MPDVFVFLHITKRKSAMNLIDFNRQFPNEEACRQRLKAVREQHEVFNSEDDDREEKLKEFLNSLSEDELNKLCIRYAEITHAAGYANPLTISMLNKSKIDEGLTRTYPINKTISHISSYFNLHPRQIVKKVSAENEISHILVFIPSIKDNVQVMIEAMKSCGYYLGSPKLENIKPNTWVWLQFEPKTQEDNSEQIRNEEKTLMHLTPINNLRKIQSIGFSPRCKNELFNYPNRLYFLRGSQDKNEIMNIGQQLCDANSSVDNEGKYALITLDLSRIPSEVNFSMDPNYPYGIFTTNNIRPDVITNVEVIEFEL